MKWAAMNRRLQWRLILVAAGALALMVSLWIKPGWPGVPVELAVFLLFSDCSIIDTSCKAESAWLYALVWSVFAVPAVLLGAALWRWVRAAM
jgi:hypothetical protein